MQFKWVIVVTIISVPRANGSYQAPIKAGGEEIAAGRKRSRKIPCVS